MCIVWAVKLFKSFFSCFMFACFVKICIRKYYSKVWSQKVFERNLWCSPKLYLFDKNTVRIVIIWDIIQSNNGFLFKYILNVNIMEFNIIYIIELFKMFIFKKCIAAKLSFPSHMLIWFSFHTFLNSYQYWKQFNTFAFTSKKVLSISIYWESIQSKFSSVKKLIKKLYK